MTKYVHIHAKCQAFEIFEQVPEKKAVSRLKNIRQNFEESSFRNRRKFTDNLVVKTIIVNPALPFVNF